MLKLIIKQANWGILGTVFGFAIGFFVKIYIIDIVGVLFTQSGKTKLDGKNGKVVEGGPMTDAQVLATLVGMGTPQQLAMSAINAFKGNQTEITENNNKQKNHNEMKFTIAELHENVMKSIEALKVMNSDNSRVSYTANNALNILEESLKAFPMRFKNEETEVISEEIENNVKKGWEKVN